MDMYIYIPTKSSAWNTSLNPFRLKSCPNWNFLPEKVKLPEVILLKKQFSLKFKRSYPNKTHQPNIFSDH